MAKTFDEEKEHLLFVQNQYDEIITDTNLKIKNLPNFYQNNYEKMLEEKESLNNMINLLDRSKLKPYFARIDFINHKDNLKDICYIGKVGVSNYDNQIVTVDWRTPIASLYYDSNIGEVSYCAPEGEVKGELLVKRQYDIENGKLLNFNDVDTVSNDELLKPYLGVNADNRLKNIVSTIQSEQNKIIRNDIKNNLIIQGVAGSGKTTVALHRIAYLVYNNRDLYKPSQYMVIGPNKFFVNYISGILPDLDVNGVAQYDLVGFANKYLSEYLNVKNSLDVLNNIVNGYFDYFSYYIISMPFKKSIDNYFENYQKNLIPNQKLKFRSFDIMDYKEIKDIYLSVAGNMHKSLKIKIEKTIAILSKKIETKSNSILDRTLTHTLSKDADKDLKSKEVKDREALKKELNSSGNNILKQYFKKLLKTPIQLYSEIIESDEYLKNKGYDCKKKATEILKKNVSSEDLTPLMYIKYKLEGAENFSKYKHTVIDEAQDYNTFTFYVLKKIMYNSTFSIYGDLAQSLYSYRSIKNWEEVMHNVFSKNCELLYLQKSYRTTIEIMDEANKINKVLKYPLASPVIRHGEPVEYINCLNDSIKEILFKIINSMKSKGFNSVAIISKTQKQSDKIYELMNKDLEMNKVTSNNLKFEANVCCIPSYLTKGLEFDAAIIIDSRTDGFDVTDEMDLKLLYVSMTRALHVLKYIYFDKLNNILGDRNGK